MARKNLPKKYKCCGYPMEYKESYGEYVCEECGRIRRPIRGKAVRNENQNLKQQNRGVNDILPVNWKI